MEFDGRRPLKGHQLQVRHKHDWGRRFIKLLHCPDQVLTVMLLSSIEFCHPKTSDLVLYVVADVWSTLLERGLRFVQRRHIRNSLKERESICAWTNEIAQHQFAGD